MYILSLDEKLISQTAQSGISIWYQKCNKNPVFMTQQLHENILHQMDFNIYFCWWMKCLKYIKIRDCVRKQSLKWSFVSPYAIEMAYSFSCSFFNILHVLNTCRFLFPYIKPTYVLYLLVYFSILLYRNESRKTENGKLERSANGY